ncbi:MAG: hypothetical protein IKZ57_01950 [Spirochaetia bacterium]|nr:hypothetical protein [Spirochaetia bacterium]MBR5915191.1 hypothetical protein [Spirochaetia bacterium]
MAKLNINDFSKEQIAMAMKCETPEELVELAKANKIEITLEEAKAYLEELQDCELDIEELQDVAGGGSFYCPNDSKTCHLHKKIE